MPAAPLPVSALAAAFALALLAGPALAQEGEPATLRLVDDGQGGGPGYRFEPARVIVPSGGIVRAVNEGVEPHTVSHDVERSARLFDETNIEPGATRDVRAPTQPGEYAFKCAYHPEMTGYLVVQAPDAATPTPPTDPTGGSPAGTPSPTEQIPTPGPPLMLATLVGAALVARASRR